MLLGAAVSRSMLAVALQLAAPTSACLPYACCHDHSQPATTATTAGPLFFRPQVFELRDPTTKTIPFRKKELRVGVQDVAFGDDASHVAVQVRVGGDGFSWRWRWCWVWRQCCHTAERCTAVFTVSAGQSDLADRTPFVAAVPVCRRRAW